MIETSVLTSTHDLLMLSQEYELKNLIGLVRYRVPDFSIQSHPSRRKYQADCNSK